MEAKQCETCGNSYDKAFQVVLGGATHLFDSFECAIEALAPRCANCGVRVVGHGVEEGTSICCCKHCAAAIAKSSQPKGATAIRDRA
jgi:hypothetical protein